MFKLNNKIIGYDTVLLYISQRDKMTNLQENLTALSADLAIFERKKFSI